MNLDATLKVRAWTLWQKIHDASKSGNKAWFSISSPLSQCTNSWIRLSQIARQTMNHTYGFKLFVSELLSFRGRKICCSSLVRPSSVLWGKQISDRLSDNEWTFDLQQHYSYEITIKMATFVLRPQQGGRDIAIPSGKTTIGRGPFLGVKDHSHTAVRCKHSVFFFDHLMLIISRNLSPIGFW